MKKKISANTDKWIRRVVFVIALLVFFYSGSKIVIYLVEQRQASNQYGDLRTVIAGDGLLSEEELKKRYGISDDASEEHVPAKAYEEGYVRDTKPGNSGFYIDVEELLPVYEIKEEEVDRVEGLRQLNAVNQDCVFWLNIPDTVIDYPVMYHPSIRDYYLRRGFDRQYLNAGSLYLAEVCDPFTSDNLVIHGHNMNIGTMFHDLLKYKEKTFWEKQPYIYLTTLEGVETYKVFATSLVYVDVKNEFDYYNFAKAKDENDYDSFVAKILSRSFYDTGERPVYGTKLLTLSTCEYTLTSTNRRIVVCAYQVAEEEHEEGEETSEVDASGSGSGEKTSE